MYAPITNTSFITDDSIGGIDVYVREYGQTGNHDEFYTNPKIINAFKSYVSAVVSRYADNSTIFGWELANDLRCSSTLPASSTCSTKTITTWVADICMFHLVSLLDGN